MRFFIFLVTLTVLMVSSPSALAYVEGVDGEIQQSQAARLELMVGNTGVEYTADFSFHAFAVDQPEGIEVRFLVGEDWTAWRWPAIEEDGYGDFSELLYTEPTRVFQIRSEVARMVRFTLLRAVVPSLAEVSTVSGGSSSPFRIVSRSQWGADESWRVKRDNGGQEESNGEGKDSTGICDPIEQKFVAQFQVDRLVDVNELGQSLTWPTAYSREVKKIVVHHTAAKMKDLNSDGRIDETDYRLAVKNIYQYHALSRGWGDIGYNFLVDPLGSVYEGRAGGEKVVGAHVLCQNTGTTGIAVMGNFDEETVSREAFLGLARIVQRESKLYGINPSGMSQFRGFVLPHILGHKELAEVTKKEIGRGATRCPGDGLTAMLGRLRATVKSGSFDGATLGFIPYKDFDYQLSGSVPRVDMKPSDRLTVGIALQNIGVEPWSFARLSFKGSTASAVKAEAVLMKEQTLSTGGIAHFDVVLESAFRGGRSNVSFSLEVNGKVLEGTLLLPVVVEAPRYMYELVSSKGFELPILAGAERDVLVTVKNTSNFMWDPAHVSLAAVRQRGQLFVVDRQQPMVSLKAKVLPGETTSFLWHQVFPGRAGTLVLKYVPVLDAKQGFKGPDIGGVLVLEEPKIAVRLTAAGVLRRLAPGEEVEVRFGLQNDGNFDWVPDATSITLADGSKLALSEIVGVGKSFVFSRRVRAPYFGNVASVSGAIVSSRYGRQVARFEKEFRVVGRAFLRAALKGQATIDAVKQDQQVWVEFENTGKVPWYYDGERVELVVTDTPELAHSTWVSRKVVGTMKQEKVEPGGVARFEFSIRIPSRVPVRGLEDVLALQIGGREIVGGKVQLKIKNEKLKNDVSAGASLSNTKDVSPSPDRSFPQQFPVQEVPPMRVLISSFHEFVAEVTSPGAMVVWDSRDGLVREVRGGEVASIDAKSLGNGIVRVRAQGAEYLELFNWDRVPAWVKDGGINDNRFRGVLEFRRGEEGSLFMMNELPLEEYMKGIAEEPEDDSVSQEKRKVIAVLARSYALHYVTSGFQKFSGKPYNASDDPAVFQKYLGYAWEQRSQNWQMALAQTADEVVQYRGEVLRAAYFSCSDGRTKTPAEAKFDLKYFSTVAEVYKSVADPLGVDSVRLSKNQCGHGVGLSGLGATRMAEQGKGYVEIIQYYYQGVEVGKN